MKKMLFTVSVLTGLTALLLATPVVLADTAEDNELSSIFYEATQKECLSQMAESKELSKYTGMADVICPCLETYLKGHYLIDDIRFLASMEIKTENKETLTDEESKRRESLLDISGDAGTQCAKDYFDKHPSASNN